MTPTPPAGDEDCPDRCPLVDLACRSCWRATVHRRSNRPVCRCWGRKLEKPA